MKKSVLASLMLAGGAVLLWVSSRLAWLTVTADDDKAGTKTVTIHGASWSTELIAAAIMLAAAAIAGLILRRAGRRIVGGLAAVVAAADGWFILQVLVGGTPDAQRALAILSTNNTTSATKGAQLTSWAQITAIDVNTPPVILALIGAAIGLVGGVILAAYAIRAQTAPDRTYRRGTGGGTGFRPGALGRHRRRHRSHRRCRHSRP